jgi:hypothetical protein
MLTRPLIHSILAAAILTPMLMAAPAFSQAQGNQRCDQPGNLNSVQQFACAEELKRKSKKKKPKLPPPPTKKDEPVFIHSMIPPQETGGGGGGGGNGGR